MIIGPTVVRHLQNTKKQGKDTGLEVFILARVRGRNCVDERIYVERKDLIEMDGREREPIAGRWCRHRPNLSDYDIQVADSRRRAKRLDQHIEIVGVSRRENV